MNEQIDKVSIYKMNENVREFDECMSPKIISSKIKDIETSTIIGKFYYDEINSHNTTENIPWVRFFNEKLSNKITGNYKNTYSRGVFFYKLKSDNTFFVMLFGIGADAFINKSKIIFDFGIKVAMNICDADNLRRVQSSKVESITLHSEKQINNGANFSIFNIDDEKEFLRRISTKPISKYKYISVITGAETVQIKFDKDNKLSWEQLNEKTQELNTLYYSEKYKETFKNYDNFVFVNEKDEDTKNNLDGILLNKLKKHDSDAIYLTSPDFFDYDNCEFAYEEPGKNKKDNQIKTFNELSFDECFFRYKVKETTSIENLKNWKIFKYNIERRIFTRLASVYNCLVAEVEYNGNTYILFNGKWRLVNKLLQEKISKYFEKSNVKFENYDNSILKENISIWNGISEKQPKFTEATYNEKCVIGSDKLFMFDRVALQYGEMCDLLSSKKEIIHVKRYEKGSASISHLFVQARYYTDLFLSEKEVRQDMREYIKNAVNDEKNKNYQKDADKFLDVIPEDTPVDRDYTIILCILTEQKKNIEDLPFMSQYEIYHTHKYLTNNRSFKVKYVNRTIKKEIIN